MAFCYTKDAVWICKIAVQFYEIA